MLVMSVDGPLGVLWSTLALPLPLPLCPACLFQHPACCLEHALAVGWLLQPGFHPTKYFIVPIKVSSYSPEAFLARCEQLIPWHFL